MTFEKHHFITRTWDMTKEDLVLEKHKKVPVRSFE